MGDTFDAISSSRNVRLQAVVAVEGIPYLLTDGDTAAAIAAWAATEWTQALGGLEVGWNIGQRLDPWSPFQAGSSSVTLAVMDASGTNADTFGRFAFDRESMHSTILGDHDLEPGTAAVGVLDSSDFAASGAVYIGSETIAYNTNDVGGSQFTGTTRGYWAPFRHEDGTGFARTHRLAENIEGIDADATRSTTVSDAPTDWRGRWVGVWLHRIVDGVLDVKAEAHLAFAGKIATLRGGPDGRTYLQCLSIHDVLKETVILRSQWRARLRDGIYLDAGTRFSANDARTYNSGGMFVGDSGEADDLVVVPVGSATPPNEIEEGQYTGSELETKINAWLTAERAAGRLLFVLGFQYQGQDPESGEPRSILGFTDPTVSADGWRTWRLNADRDSVRRFLGWTVDGIGKSGVSIGERGAAVSATAPLRIAAVPSGFLKLEAAQGTFVDQSTFMRQRFVQAVSSGGKGFVRIGTAIIPCGAPTGSGDAVELEVNVPINESIGVDPTDWPNLNPGQDGNIEVTQVLILEASFKKLLLAMLASGGGGLNWADYDLLPEQCSAAIPYDLLTTALEDELAVTTMADEPMTVIVEKPKRLVDLWNVSFIIRGGLQLMWRQGRLALAAFATPTSAATLTIGTDDRATPADTVDDMRAVVDESDADLYNVVKIAYNGNPFTGEYKDTAVLAVSGSCSNYGARPLELTARNASSGSQIVGENLLWILPTLAAMLTFLSRPQWLVKIPIDFNLFETATPGKVCLFSDLFARDPSTGRLGMTGKPALVVACNYRGWGGKAPAVGELTLMLFPRLSLAPYCPCAQVASYNAGTKVVTCEAHEQSEAGDAADASNFPIGSHVDVVQIDPDNPAAPLSWTNDIVAAQTGNDITLTTGLAGFDATKKYRLYATGYANATTAQRDKAFQANNGNGQVASLRAAYALGHFGTGQVTTFTDSPATEAFERPADLAAADGAALDTGHARGEARGVNALISYLTAAQQPEVVETISYVGGAGGTWQLAYAAPVFVGVGLTSVDWTRKLYVSPTILKAGAASADVRVTLAQRMPRSADPTVFSRNDIVRLGPYVEHTFTTTSATFENQTAVGLAIDHLQLGEGPLGGWGWLMVELGNHASFRGFGSLYVGPMVQP